MTKIKKHKLKISRSFKEELTIVGITSQVSPVKFIFDLNQSSPVKFSLNKHPLIIDIKDLPREISLYVTQEKKKEEPVVYFFSNQLRIENKKNKELFPVEDVYYIFPHLKTFDFFMVIPDNHRFNYNMLKNNFRTEYFVYFEILKMEQFKPFPIFPPVNPFL
jgi:hypothetical protein